MMHYTHEQYEDYERLVKWLEERGESLHAARQDLARWSTWSIETGEFKRNLDAEIAARKAKEAAERNEKNH